MARRRERVMPLHVFLQEASHVGLHGSVEPVGHAPKRRKIVFRSMHGRKLRDHRLDRGARIDERPQRQATRPGIGVDLLREQMVARTADDGAAVAAGMGLHQALRLENAQRLAYRAAAKPRLGSKLAFGRQLIAPHVLPAQDVPTQPLREYRGRLRLRNHSHSRGQAFPPIHASSAPPQPMVVWTPRAVNALW